MNKSNEQDGALDRLEAALGWQRKFGPMSSTQMDECVTSLATAREALERLREERDAAEVWDERTRRAWDEEARARIAAEAEARQLREDTRRLTAELKLAREGLCERDEIIDCLLQRGHFDPFVPLAAFRKIVPKGAYSLETYDEEKEWLARIEARALLAASPFVTGPHNSPQHPHEPEIPPALDTEGRCLVCGLLVRVEAAEAEVRRLTVIIRAHWSPEQADALLADSPSDGGGVRPADDPHSLVAKAILPEHTKEAS